MFKENEINEFVKLGENDVSMAETKSKGLGEVMGLDGSNEELANKVVSDVVGKVEGLIEKIRDALKNLED